MPRIKKKYWIPAMGVLLFLAGWAMGFFDVFHAPGKPRKIQCIGEDLKLPPVKLTSLKGEEVNLGDFRGKVMLIDFWATWCAPCREGIPIFNDLQKRYGREGLVVIAISLDRTKPEQVAKFLEEYKVEYINLMGDDAVVEAFSSIPGMGPLQGIPTTFLIDREGKICRRYVGLTAKKIFEEAVRGLL